MFKDKLSTCAQSRPILCKVPGQKIKSNVPDKLITKSFSQCTKNKYYETSRSLCCQILGKDFYTKESTKPIFKKHDLLTAYNSYTTIEVFIPI